ncbi:histidine phosphatase family protein [Nocardia sp. 2]|uniref:phosphoglycerate mutase (2,3-diphosphoglycerate-dependent) n=1 Tax=Nocardia acididurans TaxID=2802282 RepID=A0ABS1MCJ4_9NOCA|nr:histidine phosphatase family protein [Nocardia acididurans]MBL1078380.1 histidine phosphatase family protein [Nocardia acididurans]
MQLKSLTMVRHGESTANAALAVAQHAGEAEFDRNTRDPDTPLSELGREQAAAVGAWLAGQPVPDTILTSPYVRARQTADIALRSAAHTPLPVPTPPFPPIRQDERLRDRENGLLRGLTASGIQQRFPIEHRERNRLGRFYYRPPGGESWTDVALRLRTLLPELEGHVLVFAHDIIVVLTHYILANLDEPTILTLESANRVANASVTRWDRTDSGLQLTSYNNTSHLTSSPTPDI